MTTRGRSGVKCSVDACTSAARSLGLCPMHYQRFRKHGDAHAVPVRSFRAPVLTRLLANCVRIDAKPGQVAGCLEWRGTTRSGPYGIMQVGGRAELVHRVAYRIANGAIPDGANVCHRCDNGICVETTHLFAGSQLENMRDMIGKGRKVVLRGELAPGARLSKKDVSVIRASAETQASLARRFHVDQSHISRIKAGKVWA